VIIENFNQIAKTEERKLALEIIDAGLEAIDTKKVIRDTVRREGDTLYIGSDAYLLNDIERLFVVGVGKCSLAAGEALEEILGDLITGGIVIDVREGKLNKIQAIAGDHPFPSEKNVNATKGIIELLNRVTGKDLVIFIVSGGGSTLLCYPEAMTCIDETEILKYLYLAGVGIRDINTVRKHLSTARGGYLAKHVYPARAISLIFSDVPGDDLRFVASGPTIKDTTTIEDAKRILLESKLEEKIGIKKLNLVETPKEDKYFENIKNILVVSNKIALEAMANKARSEGFNAEIITAAFEGDARDTARGVVERIHSAPAKTVHLYGGESTVMVRHIGKGGRNLELALVALETVGEGELVISFASDGRDNTDFAGAISDMITKVSADKLGLSAEGCVDANCSYDFFEKTGDFIKTGNTGRNVSDFIVAIKS